MANKPKPTGKYVGLTGAIKAVGDVAAPAPQATGSPQLSVGSTGNPTLDAALARLIVAGPGNTKTSSYDATQDVYNLGVISTTPVRYRSTIAKSGGAAMVERSDDPNAPLNVTSTVGDQLKRLYSMGSQEVAQWQRKLYEGGFYDGGMKMSDIIPGVVDAATDKAWYNAVISAARFSQAGRDTTVEDVIDMSAQALDYSGPKGPAAPYEPTRLTDPASLRAMADQISSQLLGRRLTDAEKEQLVSQVHGSESAFYGAVRGKAQTLTDVDPQAEIQEGIQKNFKNEYDATNVANTYDLFSQIIGGSNR